MDSASYTVWYCWVYSSEEVSTASRLSPSPESSRRVIPWLTSAHMVGSNVRTVVLSSLVLVVYRMLL